MILEDIKVILGIEDDLQDKLLNALTKQAESAFKARFAIAYVPKELTFIIVEVVLKKYNRRGAEGMTSESSDGYSASYSTADDFKEYESYVYSFLDNDDKGRDGRISFA